MWRGLLKLKFSFHRNISRKGLVKFVKKKFPKKMREIEDLDRSVSVRKTTELKVKSTLCFAMISTVYVLQEDNSVGTYIMPLQGDENSFSYKADSCEYILEAKVGKKKKKTAR